MFNELLRTASVIVDARLCKKNGFLTTIDEMESPFVSHGIDYVGLMNFSSKRCNYMFVSVGGFSTFVEGCTQ